MLRRSLLTSLAALAFTWPIGRAYADDVPVPAELQATLLAKVVTYDRNLPARAGDRVHVLLVGKPSDPTSMPFVRQLSQAISGLGPFGKLPHDEEIVEFRGEADLVRKCRASRASIVYFGPGFRDDITAIRVALEQLALMTVSASPEDVPRGIVLGFDLVFGKPKLVVHLGQSRKQQVDFTAEMLKLVRIVE
ncbi:MAG: YfiR/HmsC family protein [Polyangiaceae bacterium]